MSASSVFSPAASESGTGTPQRAIPASIRAMTVSITWTAVSLG